MRTFARTVEIAAPRHVVWKVMIDVERWPDWTASVKSIEKLDPTPLKVGSRVRISQPKLRPAVWTVTQYEDGRGFTWVSRSPGVHVVGRHEIESEMKNSRVTLSVEFEGLLGGLIGRVFRNLNEQYLDWEANGLKRYCELIPRST